MSQPSSSPLPTRFKVLALVAASGGLLFAGHAWLSTSQGPMDTTSLSHQPSGQVPGTLSAPQGHALPGAGSLSAQEVAQAYARAPQEADARFKGQRLLVKGVVRQTEAGQGQVLLITLSTADEHPGLRAVLDLGAQPDGIPRPMVGQTLNLDCLNQGLLMGEPVLSDCRLRP